MGVRLQLLGPFRCEVDGEDLQISGKKPRGVLAYVATARGKRVAREKLAGTFWSLSGEEQARQSLRQCISALRKALGEHRDVLVSNDGFVELDPSQIEVDLDAVLNAPDDPSELDPKCVAGVFLKDHVYGEDPIDDWIRDERVRLQAACHRLLFKVAEREGASTEAVDTYWRILQMSPACEEAHRALMRTYADLGKRSEALAQYQACEDALARHLDAAPGPETVALFEEIRAASGSPAPAPRKVKTVPLPDKPSIAVLAFDNLSGDPSKEYLADGLSEDITTFLSHFSALHVMARNSGFAFKGTSTPIPEIGRQLGVHYVLEGSIQVAGERLRVTAQLIEAERGTHVWSQRYDRMMTDIFAVQDDIVQCIVATVAGRIEANALRRAQRKAIDDLDAYDLVLRGKYHHHRYTPEDSELAVKFFEEALEREPDYPLAQGWYVCAIGRAMNLNTDRAKLVQSDAYADLMRDGAKHVLHGLSIDEEESECVRLLAELHLYHRRYDEAERTLRQAYEINPNDDRVLNQMAAMTTYWGEPEEGRNFAEQAIRRNPYRPDYYLLNLARALMMLDRYEEALEALLQIKSAANRYLPYLAGCYAALGDDERAGSVAKRVLDQEPEFGLEHYAAAMPFRDPQHAEHLLGWMEKAGLPR